jgi:hypothetical protein
LAICIAAATDPEAKDYLRLGPESPPTSFANFTTEIKKLMDLILGDETLPNALDHIRLQTLLSLFWQPRRSNDRDLPVRLCADAVALTHSLGLHLRDTKHPGPVDDTHPLGECRTLFLTVWALDAITAAMYGRPRLLNDDDRYWGDWDDLNLESETPLFRLFLSVVDQLTQTIKQYRPQNRPKDTTYHEIPVFERLVIEAGAQDESSSNIGQRPSSSLD